MNAVRINSLAESVAQCHFQLMSDLYHNRVLELAANIPNEGMLSDPDGRSHKVSRVCGSEVVVEINLEDDGETISEIAVQSKACALGAATLSVLAEHAVGATTQEVLETRDALRAMLKEGGTPPSGRFWELRHLAGVRDYPQRHMSTMLAFEAAAEAIENARTRHSSMGSAAD